MKFSPDTARFFRIIALSATVYGLASAEGLASVNCIQTHLSKTVFDPGPVDGAWGEKTATALSDYAAYHDIVFSQKIDQKNAIVLCVELTSLNTNQVSPTVRRYDVNIPLDNLEEFTGRKQLDVSSLKLLTSLTNDNCRFEIFRKVIENKRVEGLASGDFTVKNGIITFGDNLWYTGGLADSSYLKEKGVLAISDGFLLHGYIPYFHMFVSPGEIAQKPLQIDFTGTESEETQKIFKVNENWPKVYPFYVDTWQSGAISLLCRSK